MNIIVSEPATPAAFAPFGDLFRCLASTGRSAPVSMVKSAHMATHAPRLTVSNLAPSTFPIMLGRLERHPHSTQTFIPMLNARFLATVAPSTQDGSPELAGVRAFVLEGDTGITYRAGVWHGSMIGLSQPTHFAVLMWRRGRGDDEFFDLDNVIRIVS